MKHITVTIRRAGLPSQRYSGLFASTADAVLSALDAAGDSACSISAKVSP